LGRTHRAVQQDHALLGPESLGAGAEDLHELVQRLVEPEDPVTSVGERIREQLPPRSRPPPPRLPLSAEPAPVDPAPPGGAPHGRIALDDGEVIAERTLPVEGGIMLGTGLPLDSVQQRLGMIHGVTPRRERAASRGTPFRFPPFGSPAARTEAG